LANPRPPEFRPAAFDRMLGTADGAETRDALPAGDPALAGVGPVAGRRLRERDTGGAEGSGNDADADVGLTLGVLTADWTSDEGAFEADMDPGPGVVVVDAAPTVASDVTLAGVVGVSVGVGVGVGVGAGVVDVTGGGASVGLIEVTVMLLIGWPAELQLETSESATACAAGCGISEIATSHPRQVWYSFATAGVHRTTMPCVSEEAMDDCMGWHWIVQSASLRTGTLRACTT